MHLSQIKYKSYQFSVSSNCMWRTGGGEFFISANSRSKYLSPCRRKEVMKAGGGLSKRTGNFFERSSL